MRRILIAALVASSLPVTGVALAKTATRSSAKKPAAAKSSGGITDTTVAACATEFVDSLNSLEDDRVLAALAPSDRLALKGRENMIGLVFGRKILNPQVKSWDKVEANGKVIGAKAVVTVDELDPVEGVKKPAEHTWFMAPDEKGVLKVSLSSVWLDQGKIGQPE